MTTSVIPGEVTPDGELVMLRFIEQSDIDSRPVSLPGKLSAFGPSRRVASRCLR
jgi:hypothetical protein